MTLLSLSAGGHSNKGTNKITCLSWIEAVILCLSLYFCYDVSNFFSAKNRKQKKGKKKKKQTKFYKFYK